MKEEQRSKEAQDLTRDVKDVATGDEEEKRLRGMRISKEAPRREREVETSQAGD